jgi:hypothetical protein
MVALTELDAASQGTTADMRRLVDHLAYDVPGVRKRIYLLDEAHRMSRDAQDVLLKPIEDNRVVVLFCTTEYAKLRDTIKSRCEVYEIRKIQKEDILGRVQKILTQEGVEYEDDAILTVIDYARGHVRDVLNRLETIAQLGAITMDSVRERLDLTVVSLYYDILLALGDASRAIELLEGACDRVGPFQVATGIAEAAMNAYRQASKIFTDYSALDRDRAAQVFARYGAATVGVAKYFLSLGAHVSRLDLICAAVALGADGVPPAASSSRVVQLPVTIAAPALPTGPPPVAAITPVAPRAASVVHLAPVPTPLKNYGDGNTPRTPIDEAGMLAPRGKGVGSAKTVHKPKVELTFAPVDDHPNGLTASDFTATLKEALRRAHHGN